MMKFFIQVCLLVLLCVQPCMAQDSTPPTFRGGGLEAFDEWVFRKVLFLCDKKVDFGDEGYVGVAFTVDKKGKIKNIYVESTFDAELAQKVVTAIKKAPDWTPATRNGEPIETEMTVKISLNYARIYFRSNKPYINSNDIRISPERSDDPQLERRMPIFSKRGVNKKENDTSDFAQWVAKEVSSRRNIPKGGRIELVFLINQEGYIEYVEVYKTNNQKLSRHVIDILYSCPKWYSPGYSEGRPVRVRYTMPITLHAPPPEDHNFN